MFTGLIRATGDVIERTGQNLEIGVNDAGFLAKAGVGDSMAVNGVCLTLTEKSSSRFSVFLSDETLKTTNLSLLRPGAKVNLESPLTLDGLLHGHLVQGHVDGTGIVEEFFRRGGSWVLKIRYSPEIDRYIVHKGSICVNGVSLTVAAKAGSLFEVAVIPETVEKTNFSGLKSGDKVNLEIDMIAKYVESLIPGRK